ncbi:MAG: hypothetical protein KDD94_07405, partial [Calditrichaeota bacterium]|nr:hypothetical protein [Calditrichota bacterium]
IYCLNRTSADYIFFAAKFNEYSKGRGGSNWFSYIAQDSRTWKRGNLDGRYDITGGRWKSKVRVEVDRQAKYGALRYKLSHMYAN